MHFGYSAVTAFNYNFTLKAEQLNFEIVDLQYVKNCGLALLTFLLPAYQLNSMEKGGSDLFITFWMCYYQSSLKDTVSMML